MNAKRLKLKVLAQKFYCINNQNKLSFVRSGASLLLGAALLIGGITGSQAQAQKCDANFSGNQIGSSKQVGFTDSSSAIFNRNAHHTWYFGNGKKDTGTNLIALQHTYSKYGQYRVCHVIKDGSCKDSACKQVKVQCDTSTTFNYSVQNGTVNFRSYSYSADSIIWNFGDGSTGSGQRPSHTYDSAGNFTVTLKVIRNQNPRCVATTQKQVKVNQTKPCNANPGFFISGDGYKRTLRGYPNQKSYRWNFGDGNTAMGKKVNHTYAKKDTYDVKLVVKGGPNCYDTNTKKVVIGNDNFLSGQIDLQNSQHNRMDTILAKLYHYDSCKGVYNKIRSKTTLYVRDSGFYRFDNLPSGKFYVKADPSRDSNLSSSYVATYHKKASKWSNADSIIINGLGNTNYGNDITIIKSTNSNGTGNITGYVGGSKANCTNKKQPADGALANVPVLLLNKNREPVDRTITDQNGNYDFGNLALSTYYIQVDLPGYQAEVKEVDLTSDKSEKQVEFNVDGPQVKVEEETTGIEEAAPNANVKIYPSPAGSQVNVEVSEVEAERVTLNISNLNGQVMDRQRISADKGNQAVQLNVSQWPSGAYILKLQDQHGQVQAVQKLMVK